MQTGTTIKSPGAGLIQTGLSLGSKKTLTAQKHPTQLTID